ncbi:hypothetical protein [Brevundimonas sp.]
MHNGLFSDLDGLLRFYNAGGVNPRPREDQVNDPLFPVADLLMARRNLTPEERDAVVAPGNAMKQPLARLWREKVLKSNWSVALAGFCHTNWSAIWRSPALKMG